MRSTLRDAKGGGRIIRGAIASTGAVVSGTGFTVVRTGTGLYVVYLLNPLPVLADVVISVGQVSSYIAFAYGFTTSGFQYATQTLAAALVDCAVTFEATEQER